MASSLLCIFFYTLDGGVDDVVESCVYLSNYIIYDCRTYAPTPQWLQDSNQGLLYLALVQNTYITSNHNRELKALLNSHTLRCLGYAWNSPPKFKPRKALLVSTHVDHLCFGDRQRGLGIGSSVWVVSSAASNDHQSRLRATLRTSQRNVFFRSSFWVRKFLGLIYSWSLTLLI